MSSVYAGTGSPATMVGMEGGGMAARRQLRHHGSKTISKESSSLSNSLCL